MSLLQSTALASANMAIVVVCLLQLSLFAFLFEVLAFDMQLALL